ncbi:MAG TPA: putative glycoside hydrolase, partial [Sphingomicrobium sp.]|nr:putative glycoside hydrolase [Sphingomicrobium sp.]
ALRKTGEWQSLAIPLGCFKSAGSDMTKVAMPFTLATAGKLTIAISDIRLASVTVPQDRCSL